MLEERLLSTKEIQYEEKEMLKNIISFFEQHNFTYFIWAGTLLGAVRHKGFIPWDDDIDLAMTRPEYDKLVNYLKEHDCKIFGDLEVIGLELGNYDIPILKVINKNIRVEESEKCDDYLWVDIFPLDAVPENNKKFYKRVSFLKNILVLKREQKRHVQLIAANGVKRFIKNIFLCVLKIWKYENYVQFYLKYCTKYNYNYDDYDFVHDTIWINPPSKYNKSCLVSKKYKFEDLIVNGIRDYDEYLTNMYGVDYMQLPPVEKRTTHSFKAWKRSQ